MPRRLASGRSHSVSTGCNRPPGGRTVLGGVHVPVVGRSATGACPRAHVQRHRLGEPAAGRARLTGGRPAVNRDHLAAVPVGLVLQHRTQLRPRGVGDGTRQRMVAHHAGHVQILEHDRLVLTNEPSTRFVRIIPPAVGDLPSRERHQRIDTSVDTDDVRRGCVVLDGGLDQQRARLLPRLEPRIPRPLTEEVRERALQMPQRLLQRHAGHLAEEGEFVGLLPPGERRRRLHVVQGSVPLGPNGRGFRRLEHT
ncbi:hypothetical protein LY41_002201 [Prauserella halophila]|nr:hypothetical protein [Prauserella halophila]